MKRCWSLLPLALFIALAATLFIQLSRTAAGDDPTRLESALTGKPLPPFTLTLLDNPNARVNSSALAHSGAALINVWATWCPTCHAEHRFLNQLAAEGVLIYGLNYKDDRQKAQAWLREQGNPYAVSLADPHGMAGMELGVYGAPETFLIDGSGIVRYRHAGALTPEVWETTLKNAWRQAVMEDER